jgi:hypothetical protein
MDMTTIGVTMTARKSGSAQSVEVAVAAEAADSKETTTDTAVSTAVEIEVDVAKARQAALHSVYPRFARKASNYAGIRGWVALTVLGKDPNGDAICYSAGTGIKSVPFDELEFMS